MSRRYRGERGRAFPDDIELADLLDEESVTELENLSRELFRGEE